MAENLLFFFNLLFAIDFALSKYIIRIFNFRVVQEWVVKESGDVYGAGGYQSRFSKVFGGFGVEGDSIVVFGVFWLFPAKILVLDLVPLNLTLVT